eukprot:424383_1
MSAICIITMTVIPVDVNLKLGLFTGIVGIILLSLTQISDAVYWRKYMEYKQIRHGYTSSLLHFYSFGCPLLAIIFYLLWTISEGMRPNIRAYIEGEWIGMLFTVLGFIAQTIHSIFIYSHLTEAVGDVPIDEATQNEQIYQMDRGEMIEMFQSIQRDPGLLTLMHTTLSNQTIVNGSSDATITNSTVSYEDDRYSHLESDEHSAGR